MRIKEEIKNYGDFWLPSAPEKRIPGILSISDGGSIELELFGVFGKIAENPKQIDRIVGHVEKKGFVTLDKCLCRNMFSSVRTPSVRDEISKSLIDVTTVFTGVAYREGEIPRFDTFTFSVEGIDEWVAISGIEDNYQFDKHTATISYELPASIPFKLNNGMELALQFAWKPRLFLNKKEAGISQKTYFHLVSQRPRELEEFISVAWKLTNFLCLAMDQVVCLDSISATFDGSYQEAEENPTMHPSVEIYSHSWPHSKDDPEIYGHNMLFEFEKIQDKAETIINNWIEGCEQSGPVFHLYVWAQKDAYPYLEARFLSLAQGLEIYHRRISDEKEMEETEFEELIKNLIERCPKERQEWLKIKLTHANEVSLRKRIKKLIEPFKDLFGNKEERKKLVNRIVDTRNDLTHHFSSESEDIEDLWILCQKMEALFQLHFLQLIGFSQEEIRSISWNCSELRRKLQ